MVIFRLRITQRSDYSGFDLYVRLKKLTVRSAVACILDQTQDVFRLLCFEGDGGVILPVGVRSMKRTLDADDGIDAGLDFSLRLVQQVGVMLAADLDSVGRCIQCSLHF